MSETGASPASVRMRRTGTTAAWASAACCLPYLLIKVMWAVGVPVGITDRSMLDDPGWMAANAFMAVVELVGVGLVVAITRPWAMRVPAWLVLFPAWMGTGLLFPIAVFAVLAGLTAASGGATGGTGDGLRPWVFVLIYTGFTGQGVALAVAFGCYVRARWGRSLAARTGDVLARLRPRRRATIAGPAIAAAALAAVVTGMYGYWAAGGGYGSPDLPWETYVGMACGSSLAVLGMLTLAVRWGRRKRLWVPATITWLGSGSLAANALLFLALGRVSGPGESAPAWSPLDTFRTIGAAAGLLAAAVGVVLLVAREPRDG